jgi:flagellar basal-body rod modification protein FlgD
VQVQGEVFGEVQALPTAINRHVDSVSLSGSGQGVVLNLDGDVSIKLDDVIQIGNS